MKVVVWSPEKAKAELKKRLRRSMEDRKSIEEHWKFSERIVYNRDEDEGVGSSTDEMNSIIGMDDEPEITDMNVNYAWKNLRFTHSQLSANPPSVLARPTSSDQEDRRKADAADRLNRYALRHYKLLEHQDRFTYLGLLYGTSFLKVFWNPHMGEITSFDESTGDLLMEGDIDFQPVRPHDMFLDPDAKTWEEVRWVFHRHELPFEEAVFRWPEKEELLKKLHKTSADKSMRQENEGKDTLEVFEFWEKGLPVNGMQGRYAVISRDGEIIDDPRTNPNRFQAPVDHYDQDIEDEAPMRPPVAELPFIFFSDVDMPNTPWGISTLKYQAPLQDILNRIDSTVLDTFKAHGIPRLLVPEGTDLADDSVTNSPYDIIKYTGAIPPNFMEALPLPALTYQLRDRVKQGIDDMAGVNESMFGQQSRETSGYSMQYATTQGNMIRRRVFNKYVLAVESLYRKYLNLIRKHWDLPRTVSVLGKENSFDTAEVKGADINGGFDLIIEYGQSLSLDPTTRRQEILQMMPLFEKAGVQNRTIMEMLKLNELEGLYDAVTQSKRRQMELFDEMIARELYLPPKPMMDHKNMLAFAYEYLMSSEFKYLPEKAQARILRHVREREQLMATDTAGNQGAGPGQPPAPPEGLPALPGPATPLNPPAE